MQAIYYTLLLFTFLDNAPIIVYAKKEMVFCEKFLSET